MYKNLRKRREKDDTELLELLHLRLKRHSMLNSVQKEKRCEKKKSEKRSLEIDAGFFSCYSTLRQKMAVPALYDSSTISELNGEAQWDGEPFYPVLIRFQLSILTNKYVQR